MFVFFLIILLVGVIGLIVGVSSWIKSKDNPRTSYGFSTTRLTAIWALAIGAVLTLVGAILFITTIVFSQGVGEAKVIISPSGEVVSSKVDPGWGTKAPWDNVVDFDLFQQQVLFAGGTDQAPSYSGGTVNGAEITASVSGGAQAFVDASLVYSIDADKVVDIYEKYRSQERFTQQIIVPSILSAVRDVPSAYTPVQFRGEKRGEATDGILASADQKLAPYGVQVNTVNLQDIRFTDQVEQSIKDVEVAQQKEQTAEAELRATQVSAQAQVVEAQAAADAARIQAQGIADANNTLNASLTPQVLQQKYLDAISKGTTFVVPEGSTPFIQTPGAAAPTPTQ